MPEYKKGVKRYKLRYHATEKDTYSVKEGKNRKCEGRMFFYLLPE